MCLKVEPEKWNIYQIERKGKRMESEALEL
jgi:hypothetical protein